MTNALLVVATLVTIDVVLSLLERLDQITYAVLERSGSISIVPK